MEASFVTIDVLEPSLFLGEERNINREAFFALGNSETDRSPGTHRLSARASSVGVFGSVTSAVW